MIMINKIDKRIGKIKVRTREIDKDIAFKEYEIECLKLKQKLLSALF